MMGQKISDEEVYRMVDEADARNDGRIDINQFKKIIIAQKQNDGDDNEEDTSDAFVSMGGNADRSGIVDASMLIDIIKN